MDTFKALNNGISNQSLLETAQNPARFFQKNTLAHSVKAVPGYMRKKGSVKSEKKHCGHSPGYSNNVDMS